MYTVRQILQSKGQQVWSVSPQEMAYVALEHMAQHGVGALLVMEGDRLVTGRAPVPYSLHAPSHPDAHASARRIHPTESSRLDRFTIVILPL